MQKRHTTNADSSRTEAIKGALPVARNSPQNPAFGLYTEKLSGTAFTVPRADNQHTWLYRILPSAAHSLYKPFSPTESTPGASNASSDKTLRFTPNQLLFEPFDINEASNWISGTQPIAGAGDPTTKTGLGINVFTAGKDMPAKQAYYSADGDLLVVLQQGVLDVQTELGRLTVRPNEILVIPRGIRYRVTLPAGTVRGYSLELYQGHFKLPELGFIGSNGLANARDFQVPVAAYEEDTNSKWSIIGKFNGELFQLHQNHSPFDVVAWHGMYYPYKYDLDRFNAIGSVSYDHIDPSIYTVLTAPSPSPGTAIADFVNFPPRWSVQEDTFRPPWYHRNTMAEFSGMIKASGTGFRPKGLKPGGAQIHNIMSAHGPESKVFESATAKELGPVKDGVDSKVFMFETSLMLGFTDWALSSSDKLAATYQEDKWAPLKVHFKKPI